ncbi:MAG: NAD-dependent epimerase/dehydratase family protein [Anaerolineae bacterium]|nr:NAD-dependent epimerase/dehydratase family protein [Anaerolineae bacterium]
MTGLDGPVLVTGANGFVGSHLVEALLGAGHEVRAMVRCTSDLSFIEHLPIELAYADVRDEASLPAACRGVAAVVHCGALTRARDEATFFRVNAEGAATLARVAGQENPHLAHFLFVSSQAAVGPSRGAADLIDEVREPHPVTWYGQSKWAAEQALHTLAREQGLPLTIVRPSAVFGPRDRDFWAQFRLIDRGLDLQIGHGPHKVSLIYVADLVAVLLRALEQPVASGRTYFASSLVAAHEELAAAISFALGKQPLRIRLPQATLGILDLYARLATRFSGQTPLLNEQRLIDLRQPYWLCSADRARRELGFEAAYRLDAAVQETADWYRGQGWL